MTMLTLTIEGKDYQIKDLTCGQVEDIQELIGAFGPKGSVSITKETNRAILAAALGTDYPEVTPDSLRKMRLGTIKKLNDMVREILRFGGFVEDPISGEASAGTEYIFPFSLRGSP